MDVAVPRGLDQLLPWVQVHTERVRADAADEILCLLRGHLGGLHHADVSKEQDIRRDVAHLIGFGQVRVLEHRALRADAKCQPEVLRDARELAVDFARALGAARHPCDQQGRVEFASHHFARQ